MNFKKVLLGSSVCLAAFGLVACGDDSSSGSSAPDETDVPDVEQPYVPPQVTNDSILLIKSLRSELVGEVYVFSGTFDLNKNDTTLALETIDNLKITEFNIKIVKVEDDGTLLATDMPFSINPVLLPADRVNLRSHDLKVDISKANTDFTDCGNFRMVIEVSATDGTVTSTQIAGIEFKRSEQYCQEEPEPVPGEIVKIPMEFYEAELTTNRSPGLILALGEITMSETADIILKKTGDGDFNITSGNGSTFAVINNGDDRDYSDDWGRGYYPEDQPGRDGVYIQDFIIKGEISGTSIDNFSREHLNEMWAVKTPDYNEATGDGFFIICLSKEADPEELTNRDFRVKLRIYKKLLQ